ncbi:outer membrane lipoprotein SlyB [Parvibaculum indicum]|uniref:outer membrane lipoprotein n=1 Tax=Parvibaculum indicum TaxID=562969 RepID=UPI0019642716|nr:hypothetical protein [Parvibaculum indicum]NIJ43488.1 outer membrane lipoprotein SlyB [Parvibaculum indicum]
MKWLGMAMLGIVMAFGVAGCAKRPSQNVYNYDEVGKSSAVSFGTVVSRREIDITGKNTGTGALIGGAAGAGAGSYIGSGAGSYIGSGDGTAWAVAGGALAGAVIGAIAEQSAADRKGVEYVVVLESGVTLTIAQDVGEKDVLLNPGDRVIVQNSGGYQRVLPAANLPTQIERPKGIKIIDPEPTQ